MIKRIFIMTLCLMMIATSMVYAEPTTVKTIEAPQNLTVELKTYEEGIPYFQLKMQVPDSVKALGEGISEDEATLFYEMECKVGNGDWKQLVGLTSIKDLLLI